MVTFCSRMAGYIPAMALPVAEVLHGGAVETAAPSEKLLDDLQVAPLPKTRLVK